LCGCGRGALWEIRASQIHYSVPEETEKGYIVGNISKELGLEPRELAERGVRIVSRGRTQLFALNPRSGSLVTAGRIDREELCAQSTRCLVNFKVLVEDRVQLYGIEIEVTDINDNAPKFQTENLEVKINEIAAPGTRYPLPEAVDRDVGLNSLQSYQLSPSHHFSLDVQTGDDGTINPELVLERALDREEEAAHHLVLTASDSGDPRRSSTVHIQVTVLDTNDNAPVFAQPIYRVKVPEDVPQGTRLLTVRASDPDEGANGRVAYKFWKISEKQSPLFELNENTGEISTAKNLDYEECAFYEMEIQAEDGGGLKGRTKVLISLEDVNDNRPEVIMTSLFSPVREDAPPGTVILLFNAHDRDSGKNGQVVCSIQESLPFQLEKSIEDYYRLLTLVTDGFLDREQTPEYNVTITATDRGKPPLSSSTTITLHIADINDNAPIFHQANYVVHVAENNPPGASIAQVSASDPDLGPNGRVSYSIVASDLEPRALSSYVSVSAQSGVVLAQRAFDHEQLRAFELTLQARDQGSPALSANASLRVLVGDRNDNAPRVLYPALGPDGSALFDTVPRAAQPGYLVTKVVAVDADSGHNAWLSYHVLQASEPGLFSLGLRTGEVRTARALGDRDAARQRLLVAVRDGGQPPLSATATLLLVFADSLQEALPDLGDHPAPSEPQAELQFYLVVALALISVLFLLAVILAIALRLRRSSIPATWGCFQPGLCVKSGPGVPPNYSEGTLPYSYNLCVAHTGKTEFNFLKCSEPLNSTQDIVCGDSPGALIPLQRGNALTPHPETIPPVSFIFCVFCNTLLVSHISGILHFYI
uniref:Cadherin domain-containing protein n=1 Tax=Equus asinus asinus TaxID=83772 RepID=A0A8C4MGV0_EQUAS